MTSESTIGHVDRARLIHPLHHPTDHADPLICARGRGAVVQDVDGREYLDGLSGLWNVNVGHGRAELADAAAAQMRELAYFSAYAGSSNIPAIQLAEKLVQLTNGWMDAVFFTTGGAEANESALKTARFYWKAQGKREKAKVIARREGYHGVTLQTMSATKIGSYWKSPGCRVSLTSRLAIPTGSKAPSEVRASVRPQPASSKKGFYAKDRSQSPLLSGNRFTAPVASFTQRKTTGLLCVKSARATTEIARLSVESSGSLVNHFTTPFSAWQLPSWKASGFPAL